MIVAFSEIDMARSFKDGTFSAMIVICDLFTTGFKQLGCFVRDPQFLYYKT